MQRFSSASPIIVRSEFVSPALLQTCRALERSGAFPEAATIMTDPESADHCNRPLTDGGKFASSIIRQTNAAIFDGGIIEDTTLRTAIKEITR